MLDIPIPTAKLYLTFILTAPTFQAIGVALEGVWHRRHRGHMEMTCETEMHADSQPDT